MLTEFFMLTLVAALMIISPGPDFAVVVRNSLTYGRMSGIYASGGIALANLCYVAINLLGIGMIIAKSAVLFSGMKILGAAYLMYLGYKGILAKPALPRVNLQKVEGSRRGFYSGFLTSILNPKACLFYLSFFSVLISPNTPKPTQIFYGVWVCVLALLWFMLVAVFFTSPIIGKKIESLKHWLERCTGGVLILLGLKLIGSEVSR